MRDREGHNVRHSQEPQREASWPLQSDFLKELLLQTEQQRAPKHSGHKAGSHLKRSADSSAQTCWSPLKNANVCEQNGRDYDSVNDSRQNANAPLTQPSHVRPRNGGNRAPDDEHAPTPRTTRTTSSPGSSGWKVGATCSFPRKSVFIQTVSETNANTPLNSTRWMRNS